MPVELTPPRGTFDARPPRGPQWLLKAAMYAGSAFMRRRDFPVVQITTVGARTSQERSASHPAWYFNMAKHPDTIWLCDASGRRVRVEAETISGPQAEAAYSKLTTIWKGYASYRQKTDRQIPIVRLTTLE